MMQSANPQPQLLMNTQIKVQIIFFFFFLIDTMPQDKCVVCMKTSIGPCRCGKETCIKHRPETQHHCTFDYKEAEARRLQKTLVKVEGQKVVPI